MLNIGIIDDRKDQRETLKRRVDTELSDISEKWRCIDSAPLPSLEDYSIWLTENKVCILLLDERLAEQTEVDYNGHDVVSHLRPIYPTLPIFIITTFDGDPELEESFKDVEEIINRELFVDKAADYIPRIIRSSQKYLETYESELIELSDKSRKIALGKANASDMKIVEAIQNKINLVFSYETLESRSEWISAFESNLDALEKMKKDIQKHLKKTKKK